MGIRELRANLATVARSAESGQRVVITIDGQPVAQLGPVEPVDRQLSIHDLAARGLITPARRSDRPQPEFVLPMWAGTRTDQLVREIRGR